MLILNRSQVRLSRMAAILNPTEAASIVDGQALCNVLSASGDGFAARSTNSTTQTFLGVAAGPARGVARAVYSEQVAPVTGAATVDLKYLAIGSDITVQDETGTRLTLVTAAPSAGEVQYATSSDGSHTTLTFEATDLGKIYYVVYAYNRSLVDLSTQYPGHAHGSGPYAEEQTMQVPVILNGIIATDMFVAGEDWSVQYTTAPQLKVGAGGLFYPGNSSSSGTALPNAVLIKAPSPDDPVLIFDLR